MPRQKRDNIFPIRMTEKERKDLRDLAESEHRTEADMVRMAIKEAIIRRKKPPDPRT